MKNKTVLITGSTSGIGRVSAEKFAELGLTVLLHGRDRKRIDQAINEIKETTKNQNVFGYEADLSKLDQVTFLAEAVKRDYESLDVLINNAGLGPHHDHIFEVNYLATVKLCFELEELLKKAKGRIINISSEAQSPVDLEHFMSATGFSAYAQSKLAVIQFSFLYERYLEESGVKVFALDPGSFLSTKMVKETYGSDGRDIMIGVNAHLKLALSDEVQKIHGKFFSEGKIAKAHRDAYNEELQTKLMELTKALL